jgi:hypothetical protein
MSHLARRRSIATVTTLFVLLGLMLLATAGPAAAASKPLNGGSMQFTFTPTLASIYTGNGYPVYPVAPAKMQWTADSIRLTFPVTGGAWDKTSGTGQVKQKGGFYLVRTASSSWRFWRITKFSAVVNTAPVLNVLVAGGTRVDAWTLDMTSATVTYPTMHGRHYVKIVGAQLKFSTQGSASMLSALGAGPPSGYLWGTAVILARFK